MTEKMEAMEEAGSPEDIVQALLECMVEPLLGRSSCKSKEVPTLDQQLSMAKQVDAVVLLYNYYYRKQYRDHKIEFLNFSSFCQLIVVLKPSLMTYMKLMHRSDYTDVDDLESQLSLTEKAIMRACDISSALDAVEVVPLLQKWPTSKVAVFLVDSRRENCLLMRSSMTWAVWSIIEKHLDVSSGYVFDSKCINKKKRASKIFSTGLQYADGAGLQELALSAATEATGINRSDFVVLESHLVYSLDKEKASTRFYLVQSTKLVNEEFTIPIRDVIESLQGPLVKKKPSGWSVAPAVVYFHLLPYREILSNWHSRELLSNGLQDLNVEVLAGQAYDVHIGGSSSEKEVNQENMAQPMIKSCNTDDDDEKIVEAKRRRGTQGVSAVGLCQLGSQHSEDVAAILASREDAMRQVALTILLRKRETLHYQLRKCADDIALCDEAIQTKSNGGENDLAVKIEAAIDGCNDMCVKGEAVGDSTKPLVEDQCIVHNKGKRLSGDILTLQNQCQQLDQLCCKKLPTYQVFPFEGGFRAKVTVEGADCELISEGDTSESPCEARESAAAQMIAKVAHKYDKIHRFA